MTIEPGSIIEMTQAEIHALNKKIANDYYLLVKAAPDLLEALRPIAERGEISVEIIANARTAIAKATGKQYEN